MICTFENSTAGLVSDEDAACAPGVKCFFIYYLRSVLYCLYRLQAFLSKLLLISSVHFFLHGPPLFHLSTEKVPVRSVGNGHESGHSRADTINKNMNIRSKMFPYREKILEYTEKIT